MTMARGKVRRGSTTSPAIMGASSSPANPKQRLAKNKIVGNAAKSGTSDASGIGVAEPKRSSAVMPTRNSTVDGTHCAMPPMFCTQRPDFMPTMLKTSATTRRPTAAVAV